MHRSRLLQHLCLKESGLKALWQAYQYLSIMSSCTFSASTAKWNALYMFRMMNKLKTVIGGRLGILYSKIKKTLEPPQLPTPKKPCCRTYLMLWLSVLMDQVSEWMSANNQNSLHVIFVPGLTCKALVHMAPWQILGNLFDATLSKSLSSGASNVSH